MSSYPVEPLTQRSAAQIARRFVDVEIPESRKAYVRSQMRWLMDQLARRCVTESLRNREEEWDLSQRLSDAHDIISTAWYSSAPDYAGYGQGEESDPHEIYKIERARHTLWVRHDPKRAFEEGTQSEHYAAVERDSLGIAIANYLNRPHLRHPVLDWIFLDMNISAEISAFGEVLKEFALPGKRDLRSRRKVAGVWVNSHGRYHKSHGNLAEMTKFEWSEFLDRAMLWFCWWIVFPVTVSVFVTFVVGIGTETVGSWLSGIYAALAIGFGTIKLLGFVIRLVARLAGKTDSRIKMFYLWDHMYEVWKRLEGPVVNPSRVREAMMKSAEEGAVWNTVSWSLIDRVISIDPAVWVVEPQ